MNKNNGNGFLKGLLLGAIVGVGDYYFFSSTKEVKKIKEKIILKTDETLKDLSETITDFEEKAEKFKKCDGLCQFTWHYLSSSYGPMESSQNV